MAKWSKNKVNPDDINLGNEYEAKDRLSREQLNAIVNNSFYASEASAEALEKANSAFMANGTVARVGGVAQAFLDFDSQPQEQINNLRTKVVTGELPYGEYSGVQWNNTNIAVEQTLSNGLKFTDGKFVCEADGYYYIGMSARIAYNGGGGCGIFARLGGVDYIATSTDLANGNVISSHSGQAVVRLSQGDEVVFGIYFGATTTAKVHSSHIAIIKLGE